MSTGSLNSGGSATGASTQAGRPLIVSTPLGKDKLLAVGLSAAEGFNELYRFTIDVKAAVATRVEWDKLLGGPVGLALLLPGKSQAYRYFHGVCVRLRQGGTDDNFTEYQLDVVPYMWQLTKKAKSQIWQHVTVPQILKDVFKGLEYEPKFTKTYQPRDYCVQYRETDYNFATRLMEEEGMYFYFQHTGSPGGDIKSKLIVSDDKSGYGTCPGAASVEYNSKPKETVHEQDYIHSLAKTQEQVTGKFQLRDHCFELPHGPNTSDKAIPNSVKVGGVDHKLVAGDAANFEVYDWPGEFTQRFDGVPKGGGEQPEELKKIDPDGKRTVALRAEAEAAMAVNVTGSGTCRNLKPGHTVNISTQASDKYSTAIKAEGKYVLTGVTHHARLPANYRSGGGDGGFRYTNTFTAIPADVTYRPARSSPKPVVPGTQTAVVVGPPGDEIFTDKYGRIKVQFHWDRLGKKNGDSSCWVRVSQYSAGRGWGQFALPRIGQEVIIDFLEGDPDQPICVGVVYNPDQMPHYKLPDHKTRSTIRTNTSMGGDGYHEIRFEDKKDAEQIYVHSQKDLDVRVRDTRREKVGNDRHLRVGFYVPDEHKGNKAKGDKKGSQYEEIAVNRHTKIHKNFDEHIGGDYKLLVGGIDGDGNVDIHIKKTKQELIDDTSDLHVKKAVKELFDATYDQHVKQAVKEKYDATYDQHVGGAVKHLFGGTWDVHVKGDVAHTYDSGFSLHGKGDGKSKFGGDLSQTIGGKFATKAGGDVGIQCGGTLVLKASQIVLDAPLIGLNGGGGFVALNPAGVTVQGSMVLINSGGAPVKGMPAAPAAPTDAKDAANAADAKDAQDAKPVDPAEADIDTTGAKSN